MKIALVADDTCDIPKEICDEKDIHLAFIPNILGVTEYRGNLTPEMIYDYVAEKDELPRTAALSAEMYKEIFAELLKTHDAVIHFALSLGISSTCRNAQTAAFELENVFVIDTKSLSSGCGLLVLSACDKIKEGKNLQQIVQELTSEVNKIQASFVISKLNYLQKGGRCSKIMAFGANLLGLKILVQLNDGKMNASKKYIGKIERVLGKYLEDMVHDCPPNLARVFVTSSSKMPGVREKFVQQVKNLGFQDVIVADAGSTICSHCGPGTIGVFYMKK